MSDTMAEKEAFTFTWAIENFSMVPMSKNEHIQSPTFVLGVLEKTNWHLNLYPKGKSDDHLSCDLYREDDSGPSQVKVNCEFYLLVAEGISQMDFKATSETYTRKKSSSHKLLKIATLFDKQHVFLTRDCLTIRCHLWRDNSESTENIITSSLKALVACLYDGQTDVPNFAVPEELYATTGTEIMELKKKLYPYNNECTAKTRFAIEKISCVWPVKNICHFKSNQKMTLPLTVSSKKAPSLFLTIYLKGADDIQINVHKIAQSVTGTFFVTFRLVVLDIEGRDHYVSEKDHYFSSPKSDEVWEFPSFIKKSKIIEDKALCLVNDVIFLSCDIRISLGVNFSEIESYNFVSLACEKSTNSDAVGSLTEDMRSFYVDKKLCDVSLRVADGKNFPAHKAILGSRSPVFNAMFAHDTAEKKSNEVDIPDVDGRTLSLLLEFIYFDEVKNLTSKMALNLYPASDKYQILSLKKKCSSFLISNLTSKNAYEILVLADMHQDVHLKKAVQNFFYKPPYENLFSAEFESFIMNNTQLARETLHGWIQNLKSEIALSI